MTKPVESVSDELPTQHKAPSVQIITHTPVQSSDLSLPDPTDEAQARMRVLMEKENHLRNQREKYRMKYYELERIQAPQKEWAENYAIIKSLTDQLAPIYIERKQIERTGEVRHEKKLSTDEELKIAKLQNDKKKLIDKKSKLGAKIKNYLSFATGPQKVDSWKNELESVKLEIYGIEEEIKQIQE